MMTRGGKPAAFRLNRSPLYEQVADRIHQLIAEGMFVPGQRLPSETELVRMFGVSRNVVREALMILRERSLVQLGPGRGVVVTTPRLEHVATSLLELVKLTEGFSYRDFREARAVVELESVRLAVARAASEDLAVLDDLVEAMAGAEDVVALSDANVAFHRALAQASHNALLAAFYDVLAPLHRDLGLKFFAIPGAKKNAVAEHRAIVAALRRRALDEALSAALRHLRDSRYLRVLEEMGGGESQRESSEP
ncbi:MAG TPA: FadR/GntR family transcriptional regulator [Chloroflexota bacterium]